MRVLPRKPLRNQPVIRREQDDISNEILPPGLEEKLSLLKPYIKNSDDIINRSFNIGMNSKLRAALIYIESGIDKQTLNEDILRPLMQADLPPDEGYADPVANIADYLLTVGDVKSTDQLKEAVHYIYDGMVMLLVDGMNQVVVVDIHDGEFRAIDEPPGERTVRGSREGLVEILDVNISMIRRRLRDPKLVVKKTMVGKRSRNPVAILYVEDIAAPELVAEVERRIAVIDTDGIVASGYIEQFIEDQPSALFPQVWSSERPDKLTMKLLEGRIVIIVHGTPLALVVPSLFVEFLQATEDYYERTAGASYQRLLRFFAFFVAISLPALYISLLSFFPEMLPTTLITSLAQARKQVPYPVFFETIVQELIIQLVIESGLRLPGSVGQTVGVVAGIILGQAAVSAKLASPGIIIVVAITAIATFALPSSSMILASRVVRLPMLFLAAAFGLFGFSMGWLLLLTHLTSLESLGVPYFAPFAPTRYRDLQDALFRIPLWKMEKRPTSIPHQDDTRQGNTRPSGGGHGQ
ncbi:MAG: spore germination protein [Deltaproteobacteria bacterium]